MKTMKATNRRLALTSDAFGARRHVEHQVQPPKLNPAAVIYKLPDQIPWSPVNALAGQAPSLWRSDQARLLCGLHQMDKGQFISAAALHPNDRNIVVLQGNLVGRLGPEIHSQPDGAALSPISASRCIEDGAKDEDAVC